MTTMFEERERGFENKFAHDQEIDFRVNARRAKLLGLWAAAQLGLEGDEAKAYARHMAQVDFDEPSHHDLVERIEADLHGKGIAVTRRRIEDEMKRLLDVARGEVMAE